MHVRRLWWPAGGLEENKRVLARLSGPACSEKMGKPIWNHQEFETIKGQSPREPWISLHACVCANRRCSALLSIVCVFLLCSLCNRFDFKNITCDLEVVVRDNPSNEVPETAVLQIAT